LIFGTAIFSISEAELNKTKTMLLPALVLVLMLGAWAQKKEPLALSQSTPLPELHDGDFDHFAADLPGNRLFSTAE